MNSNVRGMGADAPKIWVSQQIRIAECLALLQNTVEGLTNFLFLYGIHIIKSFSRDFANCLFVKSRLPDPAHPPHYEVTPKQIQTMLSNGRKLIY